MMKKLLITLCIYIALLSATTQSMAETLYVTDRILLGVHQEASEESPVITTVASGTELSVIEYNDNFARVELKDGTIGWVSRTYLKREKPAAAELDTSLAKLKKEEELNKTLSEKITGIEKELQTRRDEASNFKTTIKELQAKLKNSETANPAATDDTALKEAQVQIASLQEQVAKLEQENKTLQEAESKIEMTDVASVQQTNRELQVRIEAALANLKGEKVPTAAELAAIRPDFPFWYWLLLIALFISGLIAGIIWFDRQHRKRHGGFRL